jgi:transcriptional regulator with XRE-family HTH domain
MARADAGLTISELARRAGVSRDTISNAERGQHSLQATTLHKVAQALGRTPSELLAEEERLAPKAQSSSLEPSLFNGVEDEQRPSLQSWIGFAGRLADRWEAEISEREHEWEAAAPPIRRNVKRVPNLQWGVEIRATAADVMAAANEELEIALGVATTAEAIALFSALQRLGRVIARTDAWYSSAGEAEAAKVIDIGEYLERMRRKIGARAS